MRNGHMAKVALNQFWENRNLILYINLYLSFYVNQLEYALTALQFQKLNTINKMFNFKKFVTNISIFPRSTMSSSNTITSSGTHYDMRNTFEKQNNGKKMDTREIHLPSEEVQLVCHVLKYQIKG